MDRINESIPIFVRITEGIKDHILSGDLKEGERLPSTTMISKEYNINHKLDEINAEIQGKVEKEADRIIAVPEVFRLILKMFVCYNKRMKKRRIIFAVTLGVLFYITFNIVTICNYSKEYNEKKSDVAIVLGAACSEKEVSEQRLNQAIKLYNENIVQCIITTGGKGKGNTVADATVAKDYLVKKGIPERAILEEKDSTITQENLENAKKIMDGKKFETTLIVSDP